MLRHERNDLYLILQSRHLESHKRAPSLARTRGHQDDGYEQAETRCFVLHALLHQETEGNKPSLQNNF